MHRTNHGLCRGDISGWARSTHAPSLPADIRVEMRPGRPVSNLAGLREGIEWSANLPPRRHDPAAVVLPAKERSQEGEPADAKVARLHGFLDGLYARLMPKPIPSDPLAGR